MGQFADRVAKRIIHLARGTVAAMDVSDWDAREVGRHRGGKRLDAIADD